jgi:serine phosphatase RsbU (regulator of sigma subunit)
MNRYFLLFLSCFFSCFASGRGHGKDSLWAVYRSTTVSDSDRIKAGHDIAWSIINNNPDSAILLSEQQVILAKKAGLRVYEGIAYNTIGVAFKNKGNYPKALEYDLKSLKIAEEVNSRQDIGNCYINLGLVYYYQLNYGKSLEYLMKAVPIEEATHSTRNLMNCYLDIGNVYFGEQKLDMAREFYEKVLKIALANKDKHSIGDSFINLGNVCFTQNDFPKALEFYQKAILVKKEVMDKQGIAECYINMGSVYNSLKEFKLAIVYADSVLRVSKEIGDIYLKKYAFDTYAEAYAGAGKYKEAYTAHVRFKQITDSIFNTDNTRQLSDLKTNFEVEKKEVELKSKAMAQAAIAEVEKKRQQVVIYAVAGLLVLVIVFAVFMFNRFRMTQKQKHIIEKQKDLVEEKQKEIVDSITYARRLQQAILPADEELKKYFPESFLLYKPKDIVAGDFYWMHADDEHVFIAAADCTGHGVPGAMVSVVCSNALNRSVKEFGLSDTGQILDKTRELVLETFAKSNSEVKDGMDISLLSLNKKNQHLSWSGANNPLWYISEGKMNLITADKQPIGKTDNAKAFTTHALTLKSGDFIYLMTDGYADQFGGEKGKKYKYKQLENDLISVSVHPPEMQKNMLAKTFEDWKGRLEQVDDVTILGLKFVL